MDCWAGEQESRVEIVTSKVALALELDFAQSDLDALAAGETALAFADAAGLLEAGYRMLGNRRETPLAQLLPSLAKKGESYYAFDGKKASFRIAPSRGSTTSVELTFHDAVPALATLDEWVPKLACAGKAFHARVTDPDWEKWQNMEILSNFEVVGRSTARLKRRWHPVLEEEGVDTSVNPGRWVARDECLEALGHQMWLMPAFWAATKADQQAIEKRLRTRVLADGILGVTLSQEPFSDDNSPTEDVRRLLFP